MQEEVSEEARAGVVSAASESDIVVARVELWAKPGTIGKQVPHAVPIFAEVGSLVRETENILERADRDQEGLTGSYIDAGRRLRDIREARKAECTRQGKPSRFREFLEESFPGRSPSTLLEYVTLAEGFDAASDDDRVQLIGLFPEGWAVVLNKIRRLKRAKKAAANTVQHAGGDAHGENLQIIHGDCMARLVKLPDESIHCAITSPPYFHLHVFPGSYSVFGGVANCIHDWEISRVVRRQHAHGCNVVERRTCKKCGADRIMLGWEDTAQEYVAHMVEIGKELYRVLRPDGVLWVEIADSVVDHKYGLVPERLVLAFKSIGWICWDKSIWHIPNRPPESIGDRLYRAHSNLFKFTKQREHYYDGQVIREPAVSPPRHFGRYADSKGTANAWLRATPRPSHGWIEKSTQCLVNPLREILR
jgi:hypothetical protein